jgi:hypothetical protein
MKTISIIALLLISLPAWTQEYKQKIGANDRVVIQAHKSEVRVIGYSGSELLIQATDYEAPPERAKGLRPLYNTAMDNTNIGLQVEKIDGGYSIKEASRQSGEYIVKVPAGVRLSIEQMNWGGGGDIVVEGVKGEIEVKSKNADVVLKNVAGPVIVNSTSGDINVEFSSFSQTGPSSINVISGDVDVTMPASSKVNFALSSISGEVFTDMDLSLAKNIKNGGDKSEDKAKAYAYSYSTSSEDGEEPKVYFRSYNDFPGRSIKATANGGGANFTIRATSSNIYLRKK